MRVFERQPGAGSMQRINEWGTVGIRKRGEGFACALSANKMYFEGAINGIRPKPDDSQKRRCKALLLVNLYLCRNSYRNSYNCHSYTSSQMHHCITLFIYTPVHSFKFPYLFDTFTYISIYIFSELIILMVNINYYNLNYKFSKQNNVQVCIYFNSLYVLTYRIYHSIDVY